MLVNLCMDKKEPVFWSDPDADVVEAELRRWQASGWAQGHIHGDGRDHHFRFIVDGGSRASESAHAYACCVLYTSKDRVKCLAAGAIFGEGALPSWQPECLAIALALHWLEAGLQGWHDLFPVTASTLDQGRRAVLSQALGPWLRLSPTRG